MRSLSLSLSLGAGAPEAVAASFTGLGFLLPGDTESVATGVSADGSVVVGASLGTSGREAFRWTAEYGMVGLGDLEGGEFFSVAYGVSADGSVVVGASLGTSGEEAFLWTQTGGMRSLKSELETVYGLNLTGWTLSRARGVSSDGLTIVGHGLNPSGYWEGWVAHLGPAAVPEPTAPLLAAGGIAGVLLSRARGRWSR